MLTLKNIALKNLWKKKHSEIKKSLCRSSNCSEDSGKRVTLFVYVLCRFLRTREPAPWQMWWRARAPYVSGAGGGDNRKQTGWNWRRAQSSRRAIKVKMEEITATHWNESASRLQTSACEHRRSRSHPTLPRFTPLFSVCRWYCYLCAGAFFSAPFSRLGNNSPRACSERHSQEQICRPRFMVSAR